MEELRTFWESQEDSAKQFHSAFRSRAVNVLLELQRALLSRRPQRPLIVKQLGAFATAVGGKMHSPARVQEGWLTPQHSSVSCFVDTSAARLPVPKDLTWSGTGDGHSIESAWEIAAYECLERGSYFLGKYVDRFQYGFKLADGELVSSAFEPMSTSGFALESTPRRAVEKGALEAIERDAYLCHWYSQTPPQRIDFPTEPLWHLVQERSKSNELVVNAYELTSWAPDVRVVLLTSISRRPKDLLRYCTGIAAHLDPIKAFRKAYFELDRFIRIANDMSFEQVQESRRFGSAMGRFFEFQDPAYYDALRLFTHDGPVRSVLRTSGSSGRKFDLSKLGFSNAMIYPGPMLKALSSRYFSCALEINELQALDYESQPKLNISRLSKFVAPGTLRVNPMVHPLP